MKPAIIISRDGVINPHKGGFIASAEDWEAIPGSIEAIAALSKRGFEIAVIGNQSCIGKGLLKPARLEEINQVIRHQVADFGGKIGGFFYCPHTENEGCPCRLPRIGLLQQVEEHFGNSVKDAPLVGDSLRDLQAARIRGCKPVLVRTGNGTQTETTTLLWPKIRSQPNFLLTDRHVDVLAHAAVFDRPNCHHRRLRLGHPIFMAFAATHAPSHHCYLVLDYGPLAAHYLRGALYHYWRTQPK
jgi:D-glycero-D-manno-heptose 1,7-bisphosphate phosphatase